MQEIEDKELSSDTLKVFDIIMDRKANQRGTLCCIVI